MLLADSTELQWQVCKLPCWILIHSPGQAGKRRRKLQLLYHAPFSQDPFLGRVSDVKTTHPGSRWHGPPLVSGCLGEVEDAQKDTDN